YSGKCTSVVVIPVQDCKNADILSPIHKGLHKIEKCDPMGSFGTRKSNPVSGPEPCMLPNRFFCLSKNIIPYMDLAEMKTRVRLKNYCRPITSVAIHVCYQINLYHPDR